ncbi:MAG: Crp/Fnr family transcriptional regulator [Bacteroidales bacterium]|nr:Crp/Fnr family transcriptional regulator [Bacteroidales bacterium]
MNITDLIRKTFPYLEKKLIEEMSEVSVLKVIKPEEQIISDGDYIKSFPVVIEGSLRVVRISDNGNELLLYYLIQGEICAMALTCCMGMQKSNIRIIAEEESSVILIPVGKIEKWIMDYRSWRELIMYSYRKRFEELIDTVDSIAFMKMDERVVRFFEERYKSTGLAYFTGTHQDIALQLNTSREVISRLLGKLEKEKLVVTERNLIDYSALVKK